MSQWQSYHFIYAPALAKQLSLVYPETGIDGADCRDVYMAELPLPYAEGQRVCPS